MKKTIVLVFLGLLVIIAAISAVIVLNGNHQSQENQVTVELYFLDETSGSLVPEQREVQYQETVEIPVKIVEQMMKGPEEKKNKKLFDGGVKLNKATFGDDGSLIIDFSQEFYSENSSMNLLRAYGVLKAVCENGALYNVSKVKVTVDGKDVIDSGGRAIGFLTAEDINLLTDSNDGESKRVALYFISPNRDGLVREYRDIRIRDQQPVEKYIVDELIKGPSEEGHGAVLSPDTEINSVETVNGICFVNFKTSFAAKNSGDSAKEAYALYSIVNSLTELSHIDAVQILIDGKKTQRFGNMDINDVLKRNTNIIL